ncbi:Indole-3-glycerol phosphate synthase [Nodularia spumigena CCY9414]|nr:Indole-3-glycerol phosphate synthase [Nodularia spumigena CCY9414]
MQGAWGKRQGCRVQGAGEKRQGACIISVSSHSPFPIPHTPHSPHPTPHSLFPTPHFVG